MIAFDPYEPAGDYTAEYFSLEEEGEDDEEENEEEGGLPENFIQLGYESRYFMTNLGSLLYILAAYLLLIPVY